MAVEPLHRDDPSVRRARLRQPWLAAPSASATTISACCGQANLFGLQLELGRREGGGVAGRFFVKQDHQGPPGFAHGGVIATALDEAMSLLLHGTGIFALTGRLEVELRAPAAVGTFIEIEADVAATEGSRIVLAAAASGEDGPIAGARGTFVEVAAPEAGA